MTVLDFHLAEQSWVPVSKAARHGQSIISRVNGSLTFVKTLLNQGHQLVRRNYSLEEYEINNGASRHFPHAIALTQQIGPFTLKFDSKLAIDVKQMRRHKYCNIRLSWISFLVFMEVMGNKFVQLFLSF